MRLSIKELVQGVKGDLILGHPKAEVHQVCLDTRKLKKGDVFFAFKGARVDGHDFAAVACREGAGAVIVEKLDWFHDFSPMKTSVIRVKNVEKSLQSLGKLIRKKFKGPVVGITGSNGKTTTKQMLSSILSVNEPGLFTKGNLNSQIGLPVALSYLSEEHQWMVLEMGASQAGNLTALAEIGKPLVGVLTGLGPAHLETFGSMEKIAEAKWELMDSLPPTGTAIVPWGEPLLEKHIRSFKRKVIFFGENSSCPVRFSDVQAGETLTFSFHLGSEKRKITLPVAGRFNALNACAAGAAAWALGRNIDQIAEGLEKFSPPAMRMETYEDASGAIFINDAYNANPASMIQAVRTVAETYSDRKIVFVLGSMLEMGPESDRWHFHLGTEMSHFEAKKVIFIGPEMEQAMNGAMSSGGHKATFQWVRTTEEALSLLDAEIKSDVAVLLKGSRGMALEKLLANKNLKKRGTQTKDVLPSI